MRPVCRPLTDDLKPAWDRFVREHPSATFFHLSAWSEVLERAFGHKNHYLLAERDGSIQGVLPLMLVRSRLFGNRLISSPFCVYGGPVAADREISEVLIREGENRLEQTGASSLELRYREFADMPVGWHSRDEALYATFRKPISGDEDANLKAIPRKQRAVVRKAMQSDLRVIRETSVDRLHAVYAQSVHNLGTPVFSQKYFRMLTEAFPGQTEITTVLRDEEALSSVMSFRFRDEIIPYYGGGLRAARDCGANDLMYWSVMCQAAREGFRLFDFGRSKAGTGAHAFKKNFGFEPSPLHYSYRLRPGEKIPENNPLNPKYKFLVDSWKRLPLKVATALGPTLIRGLG